MCILLAFGRGCDRGSLILKTHEWSGNETVTCGSVGKRRLKAGVGILLCVQALTGP